MTDLPKAVDHRKIVMTGGFTDRLLSLVTMPATTQREPALDGIRGLAVTLTFCVHFAGEKRRHLTIGKTA